MAIAGLVDLLAAAAGELPVSEEFSDDHHFAKKDLHAVLKPLDENSFLYIRVDLFQCVFAVAVFLGKKRKVADFGVPVVA